LDIALPDLCENDTTVEPPDGSARTPERALAGAARTARLPGPLLPSPRAHPAIV